MGAAAAGVSRPHRSLSVVPPVSSSCFSISRSRSLSFPQLVDMLMKNARKANQVAAARALVCEEKAKKVAELKQKQLSKRDSDRDRHSVPNVHYYTMQGLMYAPPLRALCPLDPGMTQGIRGHTATMKACLCVPPTLGPATSLRLAALPSTNLRMDGRLLFCRRAAQPRDPEPPYLRCCKNSRRDAAANLLGVRREAHLIHRHSCGSRNTQSLETALIFV